MNDEVKRFFDSINYEDDDSFINADIKKVVLNKASDSYEVHLVLPKPTNYLATAKLVKCADKGIKGEKKCKLKFIYETLNDVIVKEVFLNLLDLLIKKRPSLIDIKDSEITVEDGIIIVEVESKIEAEDVKNEAKKIIKELELMDINGYTITTILNTEKQKIIKESLKREAVTKNPTTMPITSSVIIGKHLEGEIITIDSIISDTKNILVEAYVFGIDTLEKDNINIITLKLSDRTNSILAKLFKKDKEEYREILRSISIGKWYRIQGNAEFDNFSKEIVISIRGLEKIAAKDEEAVDDAEEKRVELHTHTFMSTMDGVIPAKDLIKTAQAMGHKAVAVTDHNCLQAFPDIYNMMLWGNQGKEDKDKFKVLYGVELNVVDDNVDVVYNLKDYQLLADTFVVFDTETTGFYAGSDQMIEIGAVKIKNGEVLERFDELIDPGKPIPEKIIELTGITDDLLKGNDNEKNVTVRFLDWVGDLPMVAHNAKFDISFIEAAVDKYKLKEFTNTVVDTMSIARILNPEFINHKLTTLAKKYKVNWDEDSHHRADYDAEKTAQIFHSMCKTLDDRNIETTTNIYDSINIDELIKFSFPFHLTIIAKNQVGLKNLFKIISLANTKYLFKNDQPKIPRHEIQAHREGLLIGSGCINGEIFEAAKTKDDKELTQMMKFYDYIEVQPLKAWEHLLQVESSGFHSEAAMEKHLTKIIHVAEAAGKLVCATGDVHNLRSEDKIYRDIIVSQKTNGRFHPLNRPGITVPNMSFMTTNEMLDNFSFLTKKKALEIVVTNPNKIADMVEHVQVIKDKLYTPIMANSDEETKETVYSKAHEMYGEELPPIVAERLEKELHGIITNGYSVLYLIARKLVKKSNEDGYFVGSRGSVGSSFVATMMDITEVNGLPPHYLCPKCKKSLWEDAEGDYSHRYSSGYDLPDHTCVCGTKMQKEGQDMPFATFLGFNAEKVPDIDLNFSGENQAAAHNYTKELFGPENVYRAGTIGTVAEKTAYAYVKSYCEDRNITLRNPEIERLSMGCTGVKRTTGQHPGGIIVIPDYLDVYDFTAFQYPADEPDSSWYTTHFAFSAIHDNVLKLDILGHDDPTMLKYLGDITGVNFQTIPFDDPKVLSLFSSCKALGLKKEDINCFSGTLGIPEFGTNFVIKMLEETKPKTFSELVKISGLSHGTDVWQNNARELIIDKVVEFKDIIGCRDDIMTKLINYGMDPGTSFKISEFVRKGKASKEPDKWIEFVDIMKDGKIPEWFIKTCGKIKYMFPKAHATAYVMMGYRVAWFKLHYPLEYYSGYFSIRCNDFDVDALLGGYKSIKARLVDIQNKGYDALNKEKNIAEVLNVALEMLARGFQFHNIDIDKSAATKFVIDEDKKSLIIPFISLDGLGDSVANKIIKERELKPFISIEDLAQRGKLSTTVIDRLRVLGVLNNLPETSQLSLF